MPNWKDARFADDNIWITNVKVPLYQEKTLVYQDAQEWLDKEYPIEKRKEITELNLYEKFLIDSLTIENWPRLNRMDCSCNQLTNLIIINCPKLKELEVWSNQLTNLDFLVNLNQEKLTILSISYNNFSPQDLSIFSKFKNLERLRIEDTKLVSGLEYLPESLEEFNCKGTKLEKELKPYNGSVKAWKLQKQLELEKAKIPTFEKEILRLTNLIKSHKEKIIEAYTHFFVEKELLKELIIAHLEYTKAKQEKLPIVKLKKQKEKLWNELEEQISEEDMEKVEAILADCETLIHYETELQAQINQNQKLISDHQQVIQQITYNISSININKGHGFIGNQAIEEILETKITNTQVGNINIENSQFAGTVAIGVGQITELTEQFQAQTLQPPKSF